MATDAVPVPASRSSIFQAWGFRFLLRTALTLLAFSALWFAEDRYHAFRVRPPSPSVSHNNSLWLLSVLGTVVAGLLFGLAAWLPFTSLRYLPSRLLLAAVALVPVVHFWWIILNGHFSNANWLTRLHWWCTFEVQFALTALAGVALASGFQPKGPRIRAGDLMSP
jgi:hypothetical protein